MGESEEGQSGAPRVQESRPVAHLLRSKDEKYNVTHSTFCRVRDPNNLRVCMHTHSGTSLHFFHLPLAPDTIWDSCSKHLEPGYLGIAQYPKHTILYIYKSKISHDRYYPQGDSASEKPLKASDLTAQVLTCL